MARVLKAKGMNKCIGCFSCMLVCAGVNEKSHSLKNSSIRIMTHGGLTGHYVSKVCLACQDPACLEVCPEAALERRAGGGVILKQDKCIGCQKCVSACIAGAINFDRRKKKPVICKHCGMCVKFCPHQCLSMEEVTDAI